MRSRTIALVLAALCLAGLIALAVVAPSWSVDTPTKAAESRTALDAQESDWAPEPTGLEIASVALIGIGLGLVLVAGLRRWST